MKATTRLLSSRVGLIAFAFCAISAFIALPLWAYRIDAYVIGILGTVVSSLAALLTVWISVAQDDQLRGIEETANTLKLDSVIKENSEKFFLAHEMLPKEDYLCFRTHILVGNDDLSYTPVSEDYVVQVVQGLLRPANKKVRLKNVDRTQIREPLDSASLSSSLISLRAYLVGELINPETLPCWIYGEHDRKEIRVGGSEATGLPISPGERPFLKKDLALIARIHSNEKRCIVIDGVSQYGTWMAGQFLYDLIRQEESYRDLTPAVQNCFASALDFVAVISGTYDTNEESVVEIGVFDNNIWHLTNDGWQKVRARSV